MITYRREEKKKDWIEGDVEQQCSSNRGPSNPTGLSDSREWARPSRSQVASVIGCRLPLEGVTLDETVFFRPDNPQRGLSAEGDLEALPAAGEWVLHS